jgi:hypothetical protein
MEIEAQLRDLQPQPIAKANAVQFQRWRDALVRQLKRTADIRTINQPIEVRLNNMQTFIDRQLESIAEFDGDVVLIQAGRFRWFLGRLLQRQESMKALLDDGDVLIQQLDPRLRLLIKDGWGAVKWPTGWKALETRLRNGTPPPRKKTTKRARRVSS